MTINRDLHDICLCTVYIYYLYINKHIQYIFRKYLHVYIYIHIIYIRYKNKIFILNIYMHVCVLLYT